MVVIARAIYLVDSVNNTNNSTQSTIIDPFCKQAWMEYGRRFCINSLTGLAIGAAFAFVLLGSFSLCE